MHMKVSFLVLLALKVMIYSGNTAHIIRTPVKQRQKSNALAYNITPDSSIASPPSEPYIVCPSDGFALDITPQTPDNVNISKSVPHCTALFPQSGEDKPSPESISPDIFSSCESSICSDASILSDKKEKISFSLPKHKKMRSEKQTKSATKSISRLGRPKSSEAELRARYLDEDYVSLLLGSTRLRLFDGGQRTTCHCKCMHQCQRKFSDRKEQLKQMLQEWWGAGVDNSARKVLLMDDLLMMADPAYGQNRTIKWMILGEEVCQNFYLRARGVHRSKVAQLEQQIFSKKLSSVSAACDLRKDQDEKEAGHSKIKAWLAIYAARFGEKSSEEVLRHNDYSL